MFSSAIFIIFVGALISSSQQKSLNQRDILVELFKSTNGDGWSNNAGWLSTSSECEWFGVRCNSENQVSALHLSDNQLKGTIPSSLGQLNSLNIFLALNQLKGTIPSSLGQLYNLEWLDLSDNQLSGTIPSSLGQLNNIRYLYLSDNQLSGIIPSSLGQLNNLQWLFLFHNQLSGINQTMSLPPKLFICEMGYNMFECPLPSWAPLCQADCT
jgi:Leucine-rich repeat (LRR) protein